LGTEEIMAEGSPQKKSWRVGQSATDTHAANDRNHPPSNVTRAGMDIEPSPLLVENRIYLD